MKTLLFISAFVLCSFASFGANNNKLSKSSENESRAVGEKASVVEAVKILGNVQDAASKELLAGASILIDGKKIYSDLDGNFILTGIKPGVYKITAQLISYEPKEIQVEVKADSKISIALVQN
jgi:hypothetical protein